MNKILELGIIRSVGWIMSQIYYSEQLCNHAPTEILAMTEINLREARYKLCPIYKQHIHASIFEANNVHETVRNWKTLQQVIQILIPEVEVHRTTNANESDQLSIKKTRDAARQFLEKKSTDDPKEIKVLFEAALDLLRKEINSCTTRVFSMIGQ